MKVKTVTTITTEKQSEVEITREDIINFIKNTGDGIDIPEDAEVSVDIPNGDWYGERLVFDESSNKLNVSWNTKEASDVD